jgi:Domain of unknown function (DUF1871)
MRTRPEYDAAMDAVGAVINAWDPYSLLAGGAPSDEFEAKIATLVTRIPRLHSPADAARQISEVFSAAFELERFTIADCSDVGGQLYDRLRASGLLSSCEV